MYNRCFAFFAIQLSDQGMHSKFLTRDCSPTHGDVKWLLQPGLFMAGVCMNAA